MKKLLSILLIAGLLFVAADAYATMNRFNQDQKVLIETIINQPNQATTSTTTEGRLETLCTDSTSNKLVAGQSRILGYELTVIQGDAATNNVNSQGICSIHDAATLLAARADNEKGTLEFEAEVGTYENSRTVWFPYPYEIQNGIVVRQGCNTVVSIYYELSTR